MGSPFGEAPSSSWVVIALAGPLRNGIRPGGPWLLQSPSGVLHPGGIRGRVLSLWRRTTCTTCALFCMLYFFLWIHFFIAPGVSFQCSNCTVVLKKKKLMEMHPNHDLLQSHWKWLFFLPCLWNQNYFISFSLWLMEINIFFFDCFVKWDQKIIC